MRMIAPATLCVCMTFLFTGCDDGGELSESRNNGAAKGKGNIANKHAVSAWNGTFAQSKDYFIENRDGNATVLRVRDGNETFTGKVTMHGPNGEQRVFRYREGRKHGLCIIRDKAGARTETNYLHGIEHGLHVQFGRDGKERFRWRYENGRRIVNHFVKSTIS